VVVGVSDGAGNGSEGDVAVAIGPEAAPPPLSPGTTARRVVSPPAASARASTTLNPAIDRSTANNGKARFGM
jgi:hypothetical protein